MYPTPISAFTTFSADVNVIGFVCDGNKDRVIKTTIEIIKITIEINKSNKLANILYLSAH